MKIFANLFSILFAITLIFSCTEKQAVRAAEILNYDYSWSIPSGEAASIGTIHFKFTSDLNDSIQELSLERDGSVLDVFELEGDRAGLVVFTKSAGSGGYGNFQYLKFTPSGVVEIEMGNLTEKQGERTLGHDRCWVMENELYRSLPLYEEGDPNCCPSGEHRVFVYSWPEARWLICQEVWEGF